MIFDVEKLENGYVIKEGNIDRYGDFIDNKKAVAKNEQELGEFIIKCENELIDSVNEGLYE